MKAIFGLILSTSLLTSCSFPGGGRSISSVKVDVNRFEYVGESIEITKLDVQSDVKISIENKVSGDEKSFVRHFEVGKELLLSLDEESLPGISGDLNRVHPYKVLVQAGSQNVSIDVGVVLDKSVLMPPEVAISVTVPEKFNPLDSSGTMDNYLWDLANRWLGENIQISQLDYDQSSASLPNQLPKGIILRKYAIRGEFQKFIVPSEFVSGNEDRIIRPTVLEVIVAETTPVALISLTVVDK